MRVWNALIGKTGDHDDDVVWSNLAYPLAALAAQTSPAAVAVGLAGAALAIGSAAYHSVYEDWAQRLDIAGVMGYVAAAVSVVLAQWTFAAYLVPVVAYGLYYQSWDRINSFVHVPAWAAVGLIALAIQQGAWVLLPGGLFLAAGIVKTREPNSDHWVHSLWHLLSAGAVAGVLWVV